MGRKTKHHVRHDEATRVVRDADVPLTRDAGGDADVSRVSVESTGIHTRHALDDSGVDAAHERFGGIDVPATLVGMLTALAFLVLFGGLVGAAIGAIGYGTGVSGNEEELGIGALVGGLVSLFLAYLLGGWTAARIARYDGLRNGLMTGVWTLVLGALLGGLGAWAGAEYNVLANVDLPNWFSRETLTTSAIVSAAVAVGTMLLAGALGGKWGERYHRRADATIAAARPGGISHDARERVVRR